jgi:transcriptional regulator with XRE-family HTH domain
MPPVTRRKAKPPSRHRSKPDPVARKVGARIRVLREELGFSFEDFVAKSGLSRGYISELERGLVVPAVHTLATVAATLRLSVGDLVIGDSLRELLRLSEEMGSEEPEARAPRPSR